ncbi:MAG: glycosyltransferase [Bacteroidota bacterium]|nr:glycosyltransferase [Bacteroidota bacterium]
MKVLWFSNTPANADEYFNNELNGSGGWLQALDQSLQNHVELHIAFFDQHKEVFRYKNATYYPIPINQGILKRAIQRFFNFSSEKRKLSIFLDIIEQVKPDIIHIQGTENLFTEILPHTEVPVVISIQGIITVVRHKYCSGFENHFLHRPDRKAISIKSLLFPYSFHVEYRKFGPMQKRETKNLKLAKNIIGRTSWDNRVSRILAPNSTYYHGDEILRDAFYQHQWKPHFSDKIIIHTTNSNTFYKGFETLCMALNLLNSMGIQCVWQVAGIASENLIVKVTKEKLKKDFPQKGLLLMGHLNQSTLIEAMLRADLYVMTSHIDNSPNGLCEAMILGLPVISTFVGGVGSLMKDREEGMLIQDGDPWAMAGAILEIWNNRERAIQFGQNARKIALIRHNKERIVSDLINVYENILKTR